jgi:hypothetical protein
MAFLPVASGGGSVMLGRGARMFRQIRAGCGAVLSCLAYNVLFAFIILLSFAAVAGLAILAERLGMPREHAGDLIYLGPVLFFFLFWLFFLRNTRFECHEGGGD